MGNGLLIIPDYDTWKPRRQIYDPAFKKRQDLRLFLFCSNKSCKFFFIVHLFPTCSYLKTLLEPFNEIANRFIGNLDPLADGRTDVPMKIKFGEFTLEVISKV